MGNSSLTRSAISDSRISGSVEFHQFYLGCLAHASYLIGSEGEAAIVDPQRDVDHYIAEAQRRGLKIKYVIETHLHADFVSGHRELAARTGAEILISRHANAAFPHRAVSDGETIPLGSIQLRAVETPGHTPESVTWLVLENGEPKKALTGDTLFIGDVGRPDLAGGRGYTPQAMAGMLYDSLHQKILTLPDDVEVFPAHGAGSACGRNIAKETSSTIGLQRRTNYALRPMSREEFVAMLTADMPEAPPYFPLDAELNRLGARPLSEVHAERLTASDARRRMHLGATVLDVREASDFGGEHIPGAINIGLSGQFASWAGTLLSPRDPLIVSAGDDEDAGEAVMRLARVGFENVAGYVPLAEWDSNRSAIRQINVEELRRSGLPVVDVRRPPEYDNAHVPGAVHIPLNELPRRMSEVPRAPLAVICGSGYRSSIATSLLARAGMQDLANVTGGTSAWIKAGYPTESATPRA